MREKCNQIIAVLAIMVLLPYVITVFINGPSLKSGGTVGKNYIKVKTDSGTVEMPLDEYCMGVLAKEMSIEFKKEALKSQAVLVRTSLYKKLQEQGPDVVFEESFWTAKDMEKQWGMSKYSKYYEKLKSVWEETDGQVLMYEGKLATTPFHQLSNGKTRIGSEAFGTDEYTYLQMKECEKDIEAPKQMQTVMIDKLDCEVTTYDSAGYVAEIRVGEETMTGEAFRKNYNLASSCFTLQEYEGKLRITTKGVGHGLGLSQYTANEMAKEKKLYTEILQYFFEGTEMQEVAEILGKTE